jgi:hypothetical protein
MTQKLEGLEKITEFLRIALNSGFVDGEKPMSVLIVAPVSNGKTTVVKQFISNKNIVMTTDTTAYGMLEKYSKQLKNREIRHIIIPDLLNAVSRKKTTVDTFLLFINASSEDGIFPSKTFAYEVTDFIDPFGWVLCVTKEAYEYRKKFFKSVGFLSRFFILNYKYDISTINRILENIITEESLNIPSIKLQQRKKAKKIKGNSEVFRKLNVYAKLMSDEEDGSILRMQRKLQVFCKACAYTRGGDTVTNEDLKKVEELLELIK